MNIQTKRALLCLLLLPAPAFGGSPALEMLLHECSAIDPTKTGFRCTIKPGGGHFMTLSLIENRETMATARRAASKNEMNRIAIIYHSAGGRRFFLNSPFWTPGKIMVCVISDPQSIGCNYQQCDAKGQNCKRIDGK